MVYDRKDMKLQYDDTDCEAGKLLGSIEESDVRSLGYARTPGVQSLGSRNRSAALYPITDDLKRNRRTRGWFFCL